MTVSQALAAAHALGLDRLDAQLLLLHALGRDPHGRSWLLAHDGDNLSEDTRAHFDDAVRRRSAGEPVAYIVGHKEFFGLDLHVDARVLVPRPDTETLVEWALSCLADKPAPRVVDLGTGSGAIALALKHSRAQWQVHALDFRSDALAVARANAARLNLDVQFHQGNWLQGVEQRFSIIVSNPPYIAARDEHLAALRHEPLPALTSGPEGLDALRCIIGAARAQLKPGGWLLLEHGYDQAQAVRQLLTDAGLKQVQSRRDLAGIERCSGAQNPLD